MSGTLTLVGVGPGDPELLTLKAVNAIGAADVVVYPQKPGETSLSLSIAQMHIGATAVRLPVNVPMKVEREPAQQAYDQIAKTISSLLDEGKSVAYLCEGDPLFYGSAMYMIERLPQARVSIVPGITSLTATASAIGRPLAARNETLKVLPAPLDSEKLIFELNHTQSAAIIKVGRHFDRIRDVLTQTGHAANAIVVEHATQNCQKVTPLMDFAKDERPYFSTILCYKGDEAWGK
ncbi:precorrin-2 C(20)-methyltransferase [Maritalea porphyrae]|jgi:precorrin-2/cobalt-factor-2 C20-methyltransferase|uniref:precorrin-2 C(20)-methyltransferase n=1 Tax=Maritalea porphyrae TaxID=880732 RepID=UPI0022AEC78F|nr:precorrin-2 C(20)-methyltransferase [Maritalea porphyrae]MCZ4271768.1 precorrin-2 C(20)-methyltransferase [Maritalea porphyrae]